jgi:hypothetical protein
VSLTDDRRRRRCDTPDGDTDPRGELGELDAAPAAAAVAVVDTDSGDRACGCARDGAAGAAVAEGLVGVGVREGVELVEGVDDAEGS